MNLKDIVGDWDDFMIDLLLKDRSIIKDLNEVYREYDSKVIYPSKENVFRAFKECSYQKLSVVILLQDPYHDGSATGIALANNVGRRFSPSLRVVKDTIQRTIYDSKEFEFDPTLIKWENQGVLMLNTALTVVKGAPKSHSMFWNRFTEVFLRKLSQEKDKVFYCLWGKDASNYINLINKDTNFILTATHPVHSVYRGQPWSCDHFERINTYLISNNRNPINW